MISMHLHTFKMWLLSQLLILQESLKIVDDVVARNDVPSKSIIISMYSKILSAFKRKGVHLVIDRIIHISNYAAFGDY